MATFQKGEKLLVKDWRGEWNTDTISKIINTKGGTRLHMIHDYGNGTKTGYTLLADHPKASWKRP